MKLSESTQSILRNFSDINNSIYIRGGNRIATMSITKNVYGNAVVQEEFPESFAIYDLSQFMNGLDLFENFDLEFGHASYVTIKSNRTRVRYFYADPDIIESPPESEIKFPNPLFSFNLKSDDLKSLIKSSNVFTLPDLCLESTGGDVCLVVKDRDNNESNTVSYVVGESETPFSFNLKMENMKIISGDYQVEITEKAAKFCKAISPSDQIKKLEYYIALEPDSVYGQ